MATLHRALLASFLIATLFPSFTFGSAKNVNITSQCLSMFAKHGEMSGTQWFKDLALKLLEKFNEDDDGYQFAFMDIFLRMKVHNSSNPFQGGNVNFQFPVQKFFPSSKIDELKVDITLSGLDDILIDIHYKHEDDDSFPYKSTKLRNILITRKFVDGQWESKVGFEGSSKLVEIIILSDEATMLNMTYNDNQGKTVMLDLGYQEFGQIEAVFAINDAKYRLNVNIDVMQQTVRIVTKMPHNYMEVDIFLKWYSRPVAKDVFQDVGNFKLNIKRENVSTFNLNLLTKLVRFGPEKSIQVTLDVGHFKLIFDGTTDFVRKYCGFNALINGTDYYMGFQLDETPEDKWVVEGKGNIFQSVNVYAEFMKDFSTGSMTMMFGEERIAFFRAKDLMISEEQVKATLDYSLNIFGCSAKGSINFKKEEDSKLVGIFSKKYTPMKVDFDLTFNDYGSYNLNLKYIGDDESTFEFFQMQENGWDTLWKQRQVLNGLEKTNIEFRAVNGSYFLNIFELGLGITSLKFGRHHNSRQISLQIKPKGYKDAEVFINLDLEDPEYNSLLTRLANIFYSGSPDNDIVFPLSESSENVISTHGINKPKEDDPPMDVDISEVREIPEEVYNFEEAKGELGLSYTIKMLRDSQLVFSDFLNVNIQNSNETMYLSVDTHTKYSKEFFAYDAVCDMYGVHPSECFTKEKTNLIISLDKTTKMFGLFNPFEISESWEHDGVTTMASSLSATETPIVFNLYLPFHLPWIMNDTSLSVEADVDMLDGAVAVKTNFQDMQLELQTNMYNYQIKFTRFGRNHLSMNFNLVNQLIEGSLKANYLQRSESMLTQALCSGIDCFETVLIDAEYALDLVLNNYTVDLVLSHNQDAMQFTVGTNNKESMMDSENSPDLEDSFMKEFMRMQEGLDRLQDIGSSLPDNILNGEVSDMVPNKKAEYGFLEEESMYPEMEFSRGGKMSMNLDLMTRNFLWTVDANDGRQLNTILTWQNDTMGVNKVKLEAFGNIIWNFESQYTIDWLTPETKMGFLISRKIHLEPFEKMLVNVEDGDLTMLTNPGAPVLTIGKQSIYGMGVLGLGEGQVVTGRLSHWDRND